MVFFGIGNLHRILLSSMDNFTGCGSCNRRNRFPVMKTREEIITGMCYTFRHDYGILDSHEQRVIQTIMSQIFDNEIKPYMEFRSWADGSVYGKIVGGDITENRIDIHVKHSPAGYRIGQLVQVILPAVKDYKL